MTQRRVYLGLLLALACGGCSVDYYARELIKRRPSVLGPLSGRGKALLAEGKIDQYRRIRSEDGVEIDVWVLRAWRDRAPGKGGKADGCAAVAPAARGTVIILHGLLTPKVFYFPLAQRLAKAGYDTVLMDMRAHGASGGEYVTFGAKEKRDARAVVGALLADHSVRRPVYALGVSMGAATAVLYAAIDTNCRGVLAVAPYTDLYNVARRYVPLMSEEKYRAVLSRAEEIGDFRVADTDVLAAARSLKVPLILLQGRLDTIVPVSHGQRVYEAAGGPKRLHLVAAAGHASVLLGRENWFVEQIGELARMGKGMTKSEPACR